MAQRIEEINQIMSCDLNYPVICDVNGEICKQYTFLDRPERMTDPYGKGELRTHSTTLLIDPFHKVRMRLDYPTAVGASHDLRPAAATTKTRWFSRRWPHAACSAAGSVARTESYPSAATCRSA